jgi:hypothetical protein
MTTPPYKQPYWWEIGPTEAEELLKGNLGNRTIDKRTVAKYAKEMREGRWKVNGATISIFIDGDEILLLNGQHRLLALIEAQATITFAIVEEPSPDVFQTLDVGKNRATSQVLKMAGVPNSTAVQAVVRSDILLDESPDLPWDRSTTRAFTPAELIEWFESHDAELVQHAVHLYQEARRALAPTNTWYAAMAYQVLTKSPNKGRFLEFHHAYCTGIGLPDGSPVIALQRYTVNRRVNTPGVQSTWDRQAHLAIAIRAWNDWLSGREALHYRFGRKSLPMPRVH